MKVYKRNYSKLNVNALCGDMQAINWQEILLPDHNIDELFDSFYSNVSTIKDMHAPIRKLTKKEMKIKSKPWITPAIQKSISTKSKLYHRYLSNKSEYNCICYKRYRNKLKHLLDISKKQYYSNYFSANTKNMKNTWKDIKQLITIKSNKNIRPTKLTNNGNPITVVELIANAFKNYFSTVGCNLASSIPSVDISFKQYLTGQQSNSFFLLHQQHNRKFKRKLES